MSDIDDYLRDLGRHLHAHGRARRRLLTECRDHLADSATELGEREAVRRFGPAADLAAAADTEVAAGRAGRSTVASTLAVVATAWSTLTLLHAANGSTATPGWAIVFFGAAQTAAVSAVLATVQTHTLRCEPATPGDIALLGRRNAAALIAAALTMLAAGGAVAGKSSSPLLLIGPLLLVAAAGTVLRARALARPLDGFRRRTVRPPLPRLRPSGLLVPAAAVAAFVAFGWAYADDRGTIANATLASGIELALVVAGFVVLGPALGLRPGRATTR